jgi:hypothetical protein
MTQEITTKDFLQLAQNAAPAIIRLVRNSPAYLGRTVRIFANGKWTAAPYSGYGQDLESVLLVLLDEENTKNISSLVRALVISFSKKKART